MNDNDLSPVLGGAPRDWPFTVTSRPHFVMPVPAVTSSLEQREREVFKLECLRRQHANMSLQEKHIAERERSVSEWMQRL